MFRVAFEAEQNETLKLLDFLRFIFTENARHRIIDHPLGPSHVWKSWADETYLGFSTARLMLQSGHRFAPAELSEQPSRLPWRRNKFDIASQERTFRKFYPALEIPQVHHVLYAAHPASYYRVAEAVALSNLKVKRMLEIGAGACVHVAYRHLLHPELRTVIIDLPESMFPGYLLLRMVGIDVALPHEDRVADVTMRLPYQDVRGPFDFAFNMASFQEMELETVNRYTRLIHSLLGSGGAFQYINLRQSKQFQDNKATEYDLSGFSVPSVRDVPFHSSLDPKSPLLCIMTNKLSETAA